MKENVTDINPPKERGWSVSELVRLMGGDSITKLAILDEETASGLAAAFGTSKELWVNLDADWQASQENPA